MVANNTEINITQEDYAELLRVEIAVNTNLKLQAAALKRTVIELQESINASTSKDKKAT
tara:strand:- start:9 stop:185 length:177 start_codon:yes stop_codon:yes gene_type:complete